MGTMPPDSVLRQAFKSWALRQIKADPKHTLSFLYDPATGDWYPNRINFSDDPSADAGHMTSKWTEKPPLLALEDSDFNRNKIFNLRENKTRDGVFFEKEAVLIGQAPFQVPVELRTAMMYEETGKLARGTIAKAPKILGAKLLPNTRQFLLERPVPIQRVSVPMANSNITVNSKVGQLASNQAAVAMLGQAIGACSTWLNEWGIQHRVEEDLRTTHAQQLAEIHARGQGALIIVRIESWAHPDDTHYPNAALMGVDVIGGDNYEEALQQWMGEQRLTRGPLPGCRIDETYGWLTGPTRATSGAMPAAASTPNPAPDQPRTIPMAPLR